mgnify:CR=1 FL=1
MKIKEKLKKNKRFLLGFLLGILISSGSVYAASIISKDVSYDNSNSKLTSTNVQGAIDELYKTATDKVAEAKKECPEGYKCEKIKLCKRATTLHTEECSQSNESYYCSADGYTTSGSMGTTTITYGSLGEKGTLTSGDAFDCDVNGDGVYDSETERFYYVSDMTNGITEDSNTAVLVYYNNVSGGVASNSIAYAYDDESGENWHGPVTAVKQLPTTSQWSNVSLIDTKRQITTNNGTTSTSGGDLPVFDYTGYAARLLTYQEVQDGCYDGTTSIGKSKGLSTKCKYLMENTIYSVDNLLYGYLLENPPSGANNLYAIVGNEMKVTIRIRRVETGSYVYLGPSGATYNGIRPAIEVSKDNISY